MTKRILHVAETIKGGVATVLRQLVSPNDNFNFLCLIPEEQKQELSGLSQIATFKRTGRNIGSLLNLAIVFYKVVKTYKPDVIHLHSTFAGVICRVIIPIFFFSSRPKVIYCPHAFSFLMKTSFFKKKVYAVIEKFLQLFTDKIICVSRYEYDEGINFGLDSRKMVVIYNSVEPPIDTSGMTSPYKSSEKINILFVGRLDYQKGFDVVMQLSDRLDDRFHITVVGDRVHSDFSISPQENMTFTGWLQKDLISPYFYYGDFLLMPSRWESFGLSAVEAQSYGMPVVATNCSSLPEVVREKETGFLFSPDDIDEAYTIINSLDRDLLNEMKKSSFKFYSENFSTEKMCNKVYSVYFD